MHIVVVPASPKTGQATIRALLDDSSEPTVTGVYRDVSRAPVASTEHLRFQAVKGDVADVRSLAPSTASLLTRTPWPPSRRRCMPKQTPSRRQGKWPPMSSRP
ncbi:NAD(P)-binding protein [Apiospora kogelbergensis]|uniref:NAD(P)-binding protein n=1 Tax=Apiospora kogelbergensis TaxID=1337665 RepID=A0AAW0R6I4_9PEZI